MKSVIDALSVTRRPEVPEVRSYGTLFDHRGVRHQDSIDTLRRALADLFVLSV